MTAEASSSVMNLTSSSSLTDPVSIDKLIVELGVISEATYEGPVSTDSSSVTSSTAPDIEKMLYDEAYKKQFDCTGLIDKYTKILGNTPESNPTFMNDVLEYMLGTLDSIHDFWPGPRTGENKQTASQIDQTVKMRDFFKRYYNNKFGCAPDTDVKSILESCITCNLGDKISPSEIENNGRDFFEKITKLNKKGKRLETTYNELATEDIKLDNYDIVVINNEPKEKVGGDPNKRFENIIKSPENKKRIAEKIKDFFGIDRLYFTYDSYRSTISKIFEKETYVQRIVTPQNIADSATAQVLEGQLGSEPDEYFFPHNEGNKDLYSVKSNYFTKDRYDISYKNDGYNALDKYKFNYIMKRKKESPIETVLIYDVNHNSGPSVNYLLELHLAALNDTKWPKMVVKGGMVDLHGSLKCNTIKEDYKDNYPIFLDIKRGGDYDQIDAILKYNKQMGAQGIVGTGDILCAVKSRTEGLNTILEVGKKLYIYKMGKSLPEKELVKRELEYEIPKIRAIFATNDLINNVETFVNSINAEISVDRQITGINDHARFLLTLKKQDTYEYVKTLYTLLKELKGKYDEGKDKENDPFNILRNTISTMNTTNNIIFNADDYPNNKKLIEIINAIYNFLQLNDYNRTMIHSLITTLSTQVIFSENTKYEFIEYNPDDFNNFNTAYNALHKKIDIQQKPKKGIKTLANEYTLPMTPDNFDILVNNYNSAFRIIQINLKLKSSKDSLLLPSSSVEPWLISMYDTTLIDVTKNDKDEPAENMETESPSSDVSDVPDVPDASVSTNTTGMENKFTQIIESKYYEVILSYKDMYDNYIKKTQVPGSTIEVDKISKLFELIKKDIDDILITSIEAAKMELAKKQQKQFVSKKNKLNTIHTDVIEYKDKLVEALGSIDKNKSNDTIYEIITKFKILTTKITQYNKSIEKELLPQITVNTYTIIEKLQKLYKYRFFINLPEGRKMNKKMVDDEIKGNKLNPSKIEEYLKYIDKMKNIIEDTEVLGMPNIVAIGGIKPKFDFATYKMYQKDIRVWYGGLKPSWDMIQAIDIPKTTSSQSGGEDTIYIEVENSDTYYDDLGEYYSDVFQKLCDRASEIVNNNLNTNKQLKSVIGLNRLINRLTMLSLQNPIKITEKEQYFIQYEIEVIQNYISDEDMKQSLSVVKNNILSSKLNELIQILIVLRGRIMQLDDYLIELDNSKYNLLYHLYRDTDNNVFNLYMDLLSKFVYINKETIIKPDNNSNNISLSQNNSETKEDKCLSYSKKQIVVALALINDILYNRTTNNTSFIRTVLFPTLDVGNVKETIESGLKTGNKDELYTIINVIIEMTTNVQNKQPTAYSHIKEEYNKPILSNRMIKSGVKQPISAEKARQQRRNVSQKLRKERRIQEIKTRRNKKSGIQQFVKEAIEQEMTEASEMGGGRKQTHSNPKTRKRGLKEKHESTQPPKSKKKSFPRTLHKVNKFLKHNTRTRK